jgi:hypothetical protein
MNKIITLIILLLGLNTYCQTATEIAKIGINSTVSIVALDNISQPLGYGSGFIINYELIATNVHVIEGSTSVYVLKNGEEKKYVVSGYVAIDKTNDLVILKVSGLNGSKLSLESVKIPEIGEKIYAVGNPKGLSGTFSEGIISGIREIGDNQVIQITAPISPGSSGGPVLNNNGQVVGVAFASFTSGQNLNFAIPVKYLQNLINQTPILLPISNEKPPTKTKSETSIKPNIREGVILRNIIPCAVNGSITCVSFSIKNNLPNTISDIKILFLIYDYTGTVIDYDEVTFFNMWSSYKGTIKPNLAKTLDNYYGYQWATWKSGYKIKLRILDFKINEDKQ